MSSTGCLQRSSYTKESSTHTKTFSISNEEFNSIVAEPCFYCGKSSDPPHHFNGLDRLDSRCRVYAKAAVVSCCGTCNVCKHRYELQDFLDHCLAVACFAMRVEAPR